MTDVEQAGCSLPSILPWTLAAILRRWPQLGLKVHSVLASIGTGAVSDRPRIALPLDSTRRYLHRIGLECQDMPAYNVGPQVVAHHISTGPRTVFQPALMF